MRQYQPSSKERARAARKTDTQISIVKWEDGETTDWFKMDSNSSSVTANLVISAMWAFRWFSWSSRCPVLCNNSEGKVRGFKSHSNCNGSGVILILSSA